MKRLLLACLLVGAAGAHAQQPVLTLEGRGVQIYRCGADAKWTLVAPEAELFLNGVKVGTHGAGPVWMYADGSSVHGKLVSSQAVPGSIPWLLLRAESTAGTGQLSQVAYIVRSESKGGVADTAACTADTVNAISRVSYTATYTFYGPLLAPAK